MLSFNPSVLRRAMSFAPYAAKRPGVFSNRKKMLHQDSGMILHVFLSDFPGYFLFLSIFLLPSFCLILPIFFPPNSVAILRGSYGKC